MKKKLITIVILMLVVQVASAVRIGLRFDAHGNFINPDDYLVYTALEADKDGYKNDAMWRLKDAAEFGNKHAQYYIGLLHLQKNDNIEGLAWLKLAGEGIANNDHLMRVLTSQMNAQDLSLVEQKLTELKSTYNFEKAIERRAKWKKRLSFGGTRIKGHVPVGWRTMLPNNVVVFDYEVKKSLEDFIFDYRYDEGEVILKDFEVVEEDNNPI